MDERVKQSVQQVVERNRILEAENSRLFQKIQDLSTEVTALRATRAKFQTDCKSFIESAETDILTPTLALKKTIREQKQQISRIESQITDFNSVSNDFEITKGDMTNDNAICRQAMAKISSWRERLGIQHTDSTLCDGEEQIGQAIGRIKQFFEECAKISGESQKIKSDYQEKDQQSEDMETKLIILKAENLSLSDSNSKYEQERESLTSAVDSLRSALSQVKDSYIKSEAEIKQLKDENASLKSRLDSNGPRN